MTLTTLPGAANGEKPGGGEAARLFVGARTGEGVLRDERGGCGGGGGGTEEGAAAHARRSGERAPARCVQSASLRRGAAMEILGSIPLRLARGRVGDATPNLSPLAGVMLDGWRPIRRRPRGGPRHPRSCPGHRATTREARGMMEISILARRSHCADVMTHWNPTPLSPSSSSASRSRWSAALRSVARVRASTWTRSPRGSSQSRRPLVLGWIGRTAAAGPTPRPCPSAHAIATRRRPRFPHSSRATEAPARSSITAQAAAPSPRRRERGAGHDHARPSHADPHLLNRRASTASGVYLTSGRKRPSNPRLRQHQQQARRGSPPREGHRHCVPSSTVFRSPVSRCVTAESPRVARMPVDVNLAVG